MIVWVTLPGSQHRSAGEYVSVLELSSSFAPVLQNLNQDAHPTGHLCCRKDLPVFFPFRSTAFVLTLHKNDILIRIVFDLDKFLLLFALLLLLIPAFIIL